MTSAESRGVRLETRAVGFRYSGKAALEDIFSKEGLAYMVKVKSTAKSMSVDGALTGIVTPVHPGAQKFWKEQGWLPGNHFSVPFP
mgnify:CR=1 FL=1